MNLVSKKAAIYDPANSVQLILMAPSLQGLRWRQFPALIPWILVLQVVVGIKPKLYCIFKA